MSDTKTGGEKSPAVALAKAQTSAETVVERGGVRARIVGISGAIRDDVSMRVKDPQPPMWTNPDKGRDEPNPNDPEYLAALEAATWKRALAVTEAMAMFGIELIDGLPEDDTWLKQLQFMEKRGHVDLSAYDLDDPIEREFVFKRFVFMRPGDVRAIGVKMNLPPEEIKAAEDTF